MIRISDNTFIKEGTLSEGFITKFLNKSLSTLEQEGLFVFPSQVNNLMDLEESQNVLNSDGKEIRTTNVMGFIEYQDERVFINSRFDQEHDYFLYYMLQKVLNINVTDTFFAQNKSEILFNLLQFLFPRYLNNALKKGLYKEYKQYEHNDSNVSGVFDIDRHMKLNQPFLGKVAYNTRKFSYENNILLLVRHTIEVLRRHVSFKLIVNNNKITTDNIKKIEQMTPNYKKYDVGQLIFKNMIKPVRHGYYHEYKALQQLCIAILRNQRTHYSDLDDKDINGILFDGAWLFEEYINTVIGEYFHHPMNKGKVGKQNLFNNNTGHIYPDFVSNEKIVNSIVADAKYKLNRNIKSHDYLQIVAYLYRFDAKKGYFLYPCSNTNKIKKQSIETLQLLEGYGRNARRRESSVEVIKLGLEIPNGVDSYQRFREKMSLNEEKFIEYIRQA